MKTRTPKKGQKALSQKIKLGFQEMCREHELELEELQQILGGMMEEQCSFRDLKASNVIVNDASSAPAPMDVGISARRDPGLLSPYARVGRQVRDEKTGRLDAKKIAALFGIPVSRIADIVGVSRQTISRNPCSKTIQNKLHPFEEIARALLLMDTNPALFRQWLNTPSDELPEKISPLEFILRGHPEVVATLVANALSGQPA